VTRRLTLRARLGLLIAVAVAVAVVGCAVASWLITQQQLYKQLDDSLANPGPVSAPRRLGGNGGGPGADFIARILADCSSNSATTTTDPYGPFRLAMQVITAAGKTCNPPMSVGLTVTQADRDVATGRTNQVVHDGTTTTTGVAMRIYTRQDPNHDGVAVTTALPLAATQNALKILALLLIAVSAIGIMGATLAGLLIARAALKPVDELTDVVEHIARTEDLDTSIPEEGKDEIARLSRSFNLMTSALSASRDRQRTLIADAGHELRTPLTSMRTNIDLLMRSEALRRELPPETKSRLLISVKAQMQELSSLVGDLLELARPDQAQPSTEVVALHEVAYRAVERARLRGPGLAISAMLDPWYVHGDPGSLERAVMNLLDNAVKFSPPGGAIAVRLEKGELTVRDHGPGIPADDLPHVFDRFWRSPSARSLPGSGLGLSIVALVVGESGGTVTLEPAEGDGALARLRLPGSAAA
jgi:two-component system, OmpR family, sensor histidine kinase MprB